MKSILIVSEIFTIGGLETHIKGEITTLTNLGCKVHFAVGENWSDVFIPPQVASVHTGMGFNTNATFQNLQNTVEELRKIIRENKIELVHAHPFMSIIPAFIAAEMENIPFVVTLHGPASLSSVYGIFYDFLLKEIVLPHASLVVAVSEEVESLVKLYSKNNNVTIFPNGVSYIDKHEESMRNTDSRWLVISRLDSQKIIGILDFIKKAKAINIPGVLIAGDGDARISLEESLRNENLSDFVEFYGYTSNADSLIVKFQGVGGMGRVALEGIVNEKPVVLIGYDGIKGILDPSNFDKALLANFSGRNLTTINANLLHSQINNISLKNIKELKQKLKKNFSENQIWENFLNESNFLLSPNKTILGDIYQSLTVNDVIEELPFLSSEVMINTIWKDLPGNYKDELMMETQKKISLQNEEIKFLNSQIESLTRTLENNQSSINHKNQELQNKEETIHQLNIKLDVISKSTSWKITKPVRFIGQIYNKKFDLTYLKFKIFNFSRVFSRVIPLPIRLKLKIRTALINLLYSDSFSKPKINNKNKFLFKMGVKGNGVEGMKSENTGLIPDLISVILPVYNQADLLSESIESVLTQTYQNFELIIINDGSTDNISSVLGKYINNPKIRCFNQINQKLPKALSNGFSFANGEFWTWTSADNIMEPLMLEKLVNKLKKDQSLGMVFADYYAIDDRGELLQDQSWRAHNRPKPESGEIRLPRSVNTLNTIQDNFIGPCFMYRGWIGRCLGDYDPQLGVEDYDYWMRINAFFPIQHLGTDDILYRYRVHDNTLSANASQLNILDKAQTLMKYEISRSLAYEKPLKFIADEIIFHWLKENSVDLGNIKLLNEAESFSGLSEDSIVINSVTATKILDKLLVYEKPVVIVFNNDDTNYQKLNDLLNRKNCLAMVPDKITADRVRLISDCPILDMLSDWAFCGMSAFVKNYLFFTNTRTAEELYRILPQKINQPNGRHILLQVDGFTQGGMENVVIDLALSLQDFGYKVTICNLGKSGDAAKKAKNKGIIIDNFESNFTVEDYILYLTNKKVDIVNAHYSIFGAKECKKLGIQFIQTIHNSYVWFDPVTIQKYRDADKHTKLYICVSNTAAQYADQVLGLSVEKMKVVPNGLDPDSISSVNFLANRNQLRSEWGVSDNTPVYLNVASIMATKAQLPLVNSFSKVVEIYPDARLILLGGIHEPDYAQEIEKAICDLNLQNNVILAGYHSNVAAFYHAADVFVLPSYWEGWSLSLGEALANGLSSVITNVGSAYQFKSMDRVRVIDAPYGDITELNYHNLSAFVYGKDKKFESRLAQSMIELGQGERRPVDHKLASDLDRKIAYRTYADIFS